MPRQLPPELILQLGQYGDWRAVVSLQRVSKGIRALLAKDTNPEQNIIWRHCVQDRWDWVRQDDAWLATLGNWRRVYAYLRRVGFVARASKYENDEGPFSPRTPSLRFSRPQQYLCVPSAPMSLVEECAASEEPLAEEECSWCRKYQPTLRRFTTAYVRPGFLPFSTAYMFDHPGFRPGNYVWEAKFTVHAPRGVLLGVETEWGRCFYFDIGNCLGRVMGRDDAIIIDETGPIMGMDGPWFPYLAPVDSPTRDPARLVLVVDLWTRSLSLRADHGTYQVHVSSLGPTLWAPDNRVRLFVAFPREPLPENPAPGEAGYLFGDPIWDEPFGSSPRFGSSMTCGTGEWADGGPRGHALLHSICPVPR